MEKHQDQQQENYEESITIKGKLGPLKIQDPIVIRPFTVFIGPQGTGKSFAHPSGWEDYSLTAMRITIAGAGARTGYR